MKKQITILQVMSLIVALLITLAGCGSERVDTSSNISSIQEQSDSAKQSSSKSGNASSKKQTSSKKKTSSQKPSDTDDTESEVPLTEKEKILFGLDPTMYKTALINEGNMTRIANVMKKAQKGGTITVAVIGGSISATAGASSTESAYGSLVKTWWAENFPKATFKFVNAGFGATNSEMACYRIENDLLKYNPDFVMVDFAVNNSWNPKPMETYEAVVYRILKSKNAPGVLAILFGSTVRSYYDQGKIVQNSNDEANEVPICSAYGIPMISYDRAVWEKIRAKKITWYDIASDYIHPNDSGHLIAASLINTYLKNVKSKLTSIGATVPVAKTPVNNSYLDVKCLNQTNAGAVNLGSFYTSLGKSVNTMGWEYSAGNGTEPLKIPVNNVKQIRLFLSAPNGAQGSLNVNFNSASVNVMVSNHPTPAIVDIYIGSASSGTMTIFPNLTNGDVLIYGVFIK